jgi:hypothetical protein
MTDTDRIKIRGSNMTISAHERAIFLMSPAEFNAYVESLSGVPQEPTQEEITVKCLHCSSYAYFSFNGEQATCAGGHVIDRKGELARDDLDEMLDEIAADPIALAAYEEALLQEQEEIEAGS